MPSYSTTSGELTLAPSMASGSSLFRKLLSVGSGFTVTGWDLTVSYGGEATAAATGLTTGVPFPDLGLKWGLSYGPSVFNPPALLTNYDASSVLWWRSGADNDQFLIVPASTTWQDLYAYRFTVSSRYQFRLPSASDFCFQVANANTVTQVFSWTASLRVTYA